MAVFDVNLYEPINAAWTADTTAVTADSVIYTADGGPLVGATEVNDAAVNANIISADIYEPVASAWTADSTAVTADSNYWTADGGPLIGARDTTDAEVISAELPITGGYVEPKRPRPAIVGYGDGQLQRLEGEAHGIVGPYGKGEAPLRIRGIAQGDVGDDMEILLMLLLAA